MSNVLKLSTLLSGVLLEAVVAHLAASDTLKISTQAAEIRASQDCDEGKVYRVNSVRDAHIRRGASALIHIHGKLA